MIAVDEWIGKENSSIKMIMQVHDELVFEIKTQKLEAATKTIIDLMESAASLSVPLIAEAGYRK